jgi:hypothetical protein
MRKLIYLSAIIICLIFVYSCSQDKRYFCRCMYIPTILSPDHGQPSKHDSLTVYAQNDDDAVVKCREHGSSNTQYINNGYDYNCEID